MPSLLPGFEYDIFISYRHNDNLDGWVTDFVLSLDKELKSTIKESISIYFDKNPHDGLLETHHVDKSLEGKLRCLIFIPILSQTYCDSKSFAWQHEFCAFNKAAMKDQIGREILLANGNVSSRILPITIHNLDTEDNSTIEKEMGGRVRTIEFIFMGPGVNRPLMPEDDLRLNLNKTSYRNQINKTANAIKQIVTALTKGQEKSITVQPAHRNKKPKARFLIGSVAILLVLIFGTFYLSNPAGWYEKNAPDSFKEQLDEAEKNLEEASRFDDPRYYVATIATCKKILVRDSTNERALALLARGWCNIEQFDSASLLINRLLLKNPASTHGLFARAVLYASPFKRNYQLAIRDLLRVEEQEPDNEKVLAELSGLFLEAGDYELCLEYCRKYEAATGMLLYETLSELFLVLGDFREAERYLKIRDQSKYFSCFNVEEYQRVYLCAGEYTKLSHFTDSICSNMACDACPYWQLRALAHEGRFEEAAMVTGKAIRQSGGLALKLPAFVLTKNGKPDSAELLIKMELDAADKFISDTAYRFSLPYYSKSAIAAMQGNYDESIKWLRIYADKGFVWGSEWYIARDPLFDGLKANPQYFPEFIQIVQRAQTYKMNMREKLRESEKKN